MEHIQLALDRFKEQRQIGHGARKPDRPVGPAQLPQIVYTQTRTVDVSLPDLRERRVLAAYEDDAFSDAYKILRTQVMHRMGENGWNVLAVTSPGEREGKTLTAINLAVSLALDVNNTVLLVDADLRHPSVHEVLGLDGSKGLADYLLDDVPLPQLLVHPNIERLIVLPGGRRILHSAEALTSPKMKGLVEDLKHRYASRVVIFDLPPLLRAADVLAFSPYTDAVLLVVEESRTTSEDVERALEFLKGATPVIGTVLNKSGRLTRR